MTQFRQKIAVTGAAGQIAYSLLFRLASGEMLGHNTEIELNLLEIEPALPALEGVVMELQDCAFPLLKSINVTADPSRAFDGIDWALLVGSAPRKAGMERSDLLAKNGPIFTEQGKALNACAGQDVNIFVVGNPCNTNCLIAMNNAPDIPNNRFFAMTMLDENRAKAQLALKADVDVRAVRQMTIWGNHSSTQFPDFENASIHQTPAPELIQDQQWLRNTFIQNVQKRGGEVIKARGASSAASAANASVDSIKALRRDTQSEDTFSVALCSEGQYGIEPGLIFSYPCRLDNGHLSVIEGVNHSEFALEKIRLTHEELKQERDTVKQLGFI